jgi:hypothetical protein
MHSPCKKTWWLGPLVALFFALLGIQATAGAGQCSIMPTELHAELLDPGDPDDIDDIGDTYEPDIEPEIIGGTAESISGPPQAKVPDAGDPKKLNSILGDGSLLRLWGDLLLRIALR